MKHRTSTEEKRVAAYWFVGSVLFLALMLGAWWLVEETNEEGTHDAPLLPWFALIPFGIAVFHAVRSRLDQQ